MRIPSQFNEDNLYRRRRVAEDSAQSYRRLFRLVVGLALVIVLMNEASRPGIYRTFFGTPQTATEVPSEAARTPVESAVGQRPPTGEATPALLSTEIHPDDRQIANRLVESMSPAQQQQWSVLLSRWLRGDSIVASIPEVSPSIQTISKTFQQLEGTRRESWQAMLDSLAQDGMGGGALVPPDQQSRSIGAAWLASLDQAAQRRVVDGTVWRAADRDALFRYLDEARALNKATAMPVPQATPTGVLPLLQQPEVFLGQYVQVQGTVARSISVPATANPYGIQRYWQLWIRPADGADRPIVVVVPEVSERIEAVGPDAVLEEGPPVTVSGRFLKRLAYTSGRGADLAPVVVGYLVRFSSPRDGIETTQRPAEDAGSPATLWWTIAAAVVIGVSIAAVAMWRTAAAAREARRLRHSHHEQADTFLRSLTVPVQDDSHPSGDELENTGGAIDHDSESPH